LLGGVKKGVFSVEERKKIATWMNTKEGKFEAKRIEFQGERRIHKKTS